MKCLDAKDSGEWYSDPSTVSVKEENVFFIESSRDDYFVNGKTLQLYKFRELLNSLTAIGADMDVLAGRLYVFTPSTVKSMKLRERSNWTDASELLTTEMRYQLELNKDRIAGTKAQIKITGLRVTRATKSLCQSYRKSAKSVRHMLS